MRLEELLERGAVVVPLEASTIAEGLSSLAAAVGGTGTEGVSIRRVSPSILLARVSGKAGGEAWAALGVAARALGPDEGAGGEAGPRVLLLVSTPGGRGRPVAGRGSLELIARALGDPATESRLLAAEDSGDVRKLRPLMDAEVVPTLRVEHVLTPLGYRVFPETPLAEVVELMARKGLQALPVVGEDLRVLGLVTAGEALRFTLKRPGKGTQGGGARTTGLARDVMSRSVMCVSEEEELEDAAQVMINKDAEQLPVVREGEIVGVLTRDAVLGALFWDR